jgi:hypothetical protein
MSAPHAFALDAVALQLVAALDEYDRDTEAMISAWPDLELYRKVSAQIEKIRAYSNALPEARSQWVELLIAHAELVHFLWRLQYGDRPRASAELATVRQQHADCVAALRNRCTRIAARAEERRGERTGG